MMSATFAAWSIRNQRTDLTTRRGQDSRPTESFFRGLTRHLSYWVWGNADFGEKIMFVYVYSRGNGIISSISLFNLC